MGRLLYREYEFCVQNVVSRRQNSSVRCTVVVVLCTESIRNADGLEGILRFSHLHLAVENRLWLGVLFGESQAMEAGAPGAAPLLCFGLPSAATGFTVRAIEIEPLIVL